MSAIDIAGLVLAVVPLILEGFEAYPDSRPMQYLRTFSAAKLERREFARQLMLMNSELRFAMLDIFTRINVLLTPAQRNVLGASDSMGAEFFTVWGEVWKSNSEEIQGAFLHTIEHIKYVLDNMMELLNEMVKHTEISRHAGRETLMKIIENHDKDRTFSIRNFSKRFKFANSDSKRRKLIKRMGDDIDVLKRLNEGQEKMTKFIAAGKLVESQQSHGPFLDRVRGYCDNLYGALANIWQCECHKSPSAMLRLEKRDTPETKEANDLRFSLLLTFEHSAVGHQKLLAYQETEICVVEKSNRKKKARFEDDEGTDVEARGDSTLEPVENICRSLSTCSRDQKDRLVLVLTDKNLNYTGTHPAAHRTVDRGHVSLQNLLSKTFRCPKQFTGLNKCQCLSLAVNFASSLLQLHTTPWLPANWCDNSIYFPSSLDVLEPYVMVNFDKSYQSISTQSSFGLNPYLVALGIILLELSERKSFIERINGNEDITDNVIAKAIVAFDWFEEVRGDMSANYATVVHHCLKSSFIPVPAKMSLANEGFRGAVYRDIVQRLEAEYDTFTKPLQIISQAS